MSNSSAANSSTPGINPDLSSNETVRLNPLVNESTHIELPEGEAITTKYIDSHTIGTFEPYKWLLLGFNDFYKAPGLSVFFGLLFSIIPAAILFFAYSANNWMFLLPAAMAFSIIGPTFATVLYDISWELEKGHKPTFRHSLKTLLRNPFGEWGFAVILLLLMISWMRLAGLIYALYPSVSNPTFNDLSAFLMLGTIAGAVMTGIAFSISAFTPQILLERRIDMITAVFSSIQAVKKNAGAMVFWAALVFGLVLIGFATQAIAFIVIMPVLCYASWHGYIAVIKTKHQRHYE